MSGEASQWDMFMHLMRNNYSDKKKEWGTGNTSVFSCMYGLKDGRTLWTQSPTGFQLAKYDFTYQEEGEADPTDVVYDEFKAALQATHGTRKPYGDAGIRICNEKYQYQTRGEEKGYDWVQLSKLGGGGATIARTQKTLMVAVWNKNSMQSDGKP